MTLTPDRFDTITLPAVLSDAAYRGRERRRGGRAVGRAGDVVERITATVMGSTVVVGLLVVGLGAVASGGR